ncbi:nitrite reductase (NAD(P)H) small subunit [Enterococcus sp.]|uniref:nitrite reductase (NAD(P)H) small subunit n=1 Tax=Enterococcus sp. TaxID=35783 RepID=UPI003C728853
MKVFATNKSKLLPLVGRSVTIGDQKMALFEVSDGRIFAIDDYCPLTEAPLLEGMVAGEYVFEPMRDYKISLLDGKIQEPDQGQVAVYPVSVVGDKVYIELAD